MTAYFIYYSDILYCFVIMHMFVKCVCVPSDLYPKYYAWRLWCYTVDEISDMNDHLVGLQQTKDKDHEMFEQQLQHLRNEYEETKEKLSSENMLLSECVVCLLQFFLQITVCAGFCDSVKQVMVIRDMAEMCFDKNWNPQK